MVQRRAVVRPQAAMEVAQLAVDPGFIFGVSGVMVGITLIVSDASPAASGGMCQLASALCAAKVFAQKVSEATEMQELRHIIELFLQPSQSQLLAVRSIHFSIPAYPLSAELCYLCAGPGHGLRVAAC
jgi:hypothetical protein